jgi:hypothetical protein
MTGDTSDHIRFSSTLGREIRTADDVRALGVTTEKLARDALRIGDVENAARWTAYLAQEPRWIMAFYRPWIENLLAVGQREVSAFEDHVARLTDVIGVAPPLVDAADVGAVEEAAAVAAAAAGDEEAFDTAIADLKRAQWMVHDDQGDWLWGLFTALQRELGEDRMEQEVFREPVAPIAAERFAALASLTQYEKFEFSIDLMRGHFCGPSDDSHIDVIETDDRWVMSFDPCGSGGRMRRGDQIRGQRPRTEPPFEFAHAERAHPWTWGKENVCLYCAHCSFVNEILPIERTGIPLRVTDYPEAPGDQCRWTVYKDAAAIPEEVYRRVGKSKPATGADSAVLP